MNRRRRGRGRIIIDLTNSDDEFLPEINEIFVDTTRRRKRKISPPTYDWVMGEILATEHLPTYEEAIMEKKIRGIDRKAEKNGFCNMEFAFF
ncbi:hypothetical protein PIROE2DRAFT_8330 [Piromyces sp. E2]|nr:hypothetical protein PIROE2DRAFT_8330 [Piromyces sp. E2]|eukprot:OUM64793.1 hypothetical protein PIROE2DRAFT_8330 [Piromyces sp. E2]